MIRFLTGAAAPLLLLLLAACSASTYDGAPYTPAILAFPGAGIPGPGTPRVHLELDPPDSGFPEVELREVAGLQEKVYSYGGARGGVQGVRLLPGSLGVCPVPCGAIIDGRLGREFFFAGSRIRSSSHFHLENESGELLIKVKPGSGIQWNAGEGLVIAGTPLAIFGTILLAAQGSRSDHSSFGTVAPAAVFTATSGALIGAGILLMLTSGTTYSLHRIAPAKSGS